jgi:hypothetical protein
MFTVDIMARGINLVFNCVRLKLALIVDKYIIVQNKMIWILRNGEDNLTFAGIKNLNIDR